MLFDSYSKDGDRLILKLNPKVAPIKAAVFPLLANKPELVEKAKNVYHILKEEFLTVQFDARGNIGKSYYAQDEIGTPYCITIDFDTLKDGSVTVRDRDTAKQERIKIGDLVKHVENKISNS